MSSSKHSRRRRAESLILSNDPNHHLTGPFEPQTPRPLGSNTPERVASPVRRKGFGPTRHTSFRRKAFGWMTSPRTSLQVLLVPIVLWANWEFLTPYISPNASNPFAPFLFISGRVPTSSDDDPRYAKSWLDFLFMAYFVAFWSFVRQVVAVEISGRIARSFGIKKEAKLMRFGEQGYAIFYFACMGAWGYRIMSQLPTYWYRTEYFWIDYPHWDMKPELKSYYLMQIAYWLQQLIVLVMGLEKPRKDYYELVAHHIVTLWLVGWSYLINLTIIGNAVYMSMDIPDAFLAFSKVLNYLQMDNAKIVSFAVFMAIWTYFRHYLNIVILYSVWTEYDLIPKESQVWSPEQGAWLVWWMKYQVFVPILLLQFLNIFWYYLICRIAYRAVMTATATDDRSDDEDDGDEKDD